jgi:hypothetical protein
MPKVKIAPLTAKYIAGEIGDDWDQDAFDEELRAVRAVLKAVARWRDYDGDGDGIMVPAAEAKLTTAMALALDHLERISKGTK